MFWFFLPLFPGFQLALPFYKLLTKEPHRGHLGTWGVGTMFSGGLGFGIFWVGVFSTLGQANQTSLGTVRPGKTNRPTF